MKTLNVLLILLLAGLAACSSLPKAGSSDSPETVEITYHVKPGMDYQMQGLLNRAWTIYVAKHMVLPQSHAIVMEREYGNRPRIVETFTWVSHSTPDHAPQEVRDLWNQMQDLCEARGGHDGLEVNEVKTMQPQK